jgi:14-3-3 protein epsilon
MSSTREDNVYIAKLAEQAERYHEMVASMKLVAEENKELTAEERNLLSVAYKNATSSRRQTWRVLKSIEEQAVGKAATKHLNLIRIEKEKVERELTHLCNEILQILKNNCIPHCTFKESQVFYYKMEGDYYRYLAEYKLGKDKDLAVEGAIEAYTKGMQIASELPPTHPIRLGLVLNYSVFYYEVKEDTESAIKIAKDAFDEATPILENLTEAAHFQKPKRSRSSTLVPPPISYLYYVHVPHVYAQDGK